jgi:hypothetical protein
MSISDEFGLDDSIGPAEREFGNLGQEVGHVADEVGSGALGVVEGQVHGLGVASDLARDALLDTGLTMPADAMLGVDGALLSATDVATGFGHQVGDVLGGVGAVGRDLLDGADNVEHDFGLGQYDQLGEHVAGALSGVGGDVEQAYDSYSADGDRETAALYNDVGAVANTIVGTTSADLSQLYGDVDRDTGGAYSSAYDAVDNAVGGVVDSVENTASDAYDSAANGVAAVEDELSGL